MGVGRQRGSASLPDDLLAAGYRWAIESGEIGVRSDKIHYELHSRRIAYN